eukprot:TRINITY_DN5000_c0_g1_i1.p3 TRINITY_DN5000_c0_g1~~TRINITY_DN5000_c0_g1_i1.p3  ORF type:complete len:126 (-),score=3.03 TRINITY_DN5000_c0_g1_i1:978-1355(-)
MEYIHVQNLSNKEGSQRSKDDAQALPKNHLEGIVDINRISGRVFGVYIEPKLGGWECGNGINNQEAVANEPGSQKRNASNPRFAKIFIDDIRRDKDKWPDNCPCCEIKIEYKITQEMNLCGFGSE